MNLKKWENILSRKLKKPLSKERIAQLLKTKADDSAFLDFFASMMLTGKLIELKSGKYGYSPKMNMITGTLDVNPKGFGFVIPDEGGDDVYIGMHNMNNAMDKDRVVVKILSEKKRDGRVVSVLERSTKKIAGTLKRRGKIFYLIPDDSKILRDIIIEDASGDIEEDKKAIVEIVEFPTPKHNPVGRVTEILDYENKVDLQGRLILLEHGFDDEFPQSVINEAQSIEFSPRASGKRRDLRDETIITIDPADAKDFDDAISIREEGKGLITIGVHIADVSFFVRKDSELDREAYKRATSVYLIDKTVPMLPERLSNELCSLNPGEDRYTITCRFTVNAAGDIVSKEIFPSLIHSAIRFSYKEAQKAIDSGQGEYSGILRKMRDTARILRKKYRKNGRIDFDAPEVEVLLNENKVPVSIKPKHRLDTHMMIEDFMITANMIVAQYLSSLNISTIYRIHEEPSEAGLNSMKDMLAKFGMNIKSTSPQSIQSVIEHSEQSLNSYLVKEIVLHSMKRAIYTTENAGHYGLGLDFYTHFTSPIRRYPDLIVHRILHRLFSGKKGQLPSLELIAKHSSEREWAAEKAERNSVEITKMTFLANSKKKVYDGIISSVTPFGIFILIEDVMVEGLLRYRDMDDDFYQLEEHEMSVKGLHTGKIITVGDRVKVRIISMDPEKKAMNLAIDSFISKQQ